MYLGKFVLNLIQCDQEMPVILDNITGMFADELLYGKGFGKDKILFRKFLQ